MKVRLFSLFLLMVPFCVQADNKPSNTPQVSTIAVPTSNVATVFVRPFCFEGFQFLVSTVGKSTNANGSGGTAMIQVLRADGRPMPCAAPGAK